MANLREVSEPVAVWIDCDPGHDDAFALLLATQSPQIQILGVSTVHGNNRVENCGINAKRFLWACGASKTPVYLGAERPLLRNQKFCPEIHGESGLCGYPFPDKEIFLSAENQIGEGHAVLKMKDAIMGNEEKVTIVATGAQTNVALLLRMFPEVVPKIRRIVFMGGAIGLGNTGVAAEYNIETDPEAAHIVLHSGIPLVMIPLEVTHTILVTEEILTGIKEIGNHEIQKPTTSPASNHETVERQKPHFTKMKTAVVSKEDSAGEATFENLGSPSSFACCCYDLLYFFKSTYKELFSFSSPPLHDPCTIFYLTNPEAFETLNAYVDVETGSEKCLGRTLVDVHGILKKEPNVLVCTRVDSDKFWYKMFECLRLANSKSPLNKK